MPEKEDDFEPLPDGPYTEFARYVFQQLDVQTPTEFYSLIVRSPAARKVAVDLIVDTDAPPHELGFSDVGVLGAWAQAEKDAAGD